MTLCNALSHVGLVCYTLCIRPSVKTGVAIGCVRVLCVCAGFLGLEMPKRDTLAAKRSAPQQKCIQNDLSKLKNEWKGLLESQNEKSGLKD